MRSPLREGACKVSPTNNPATATCKRYLFDSDSAMLGTICLWLLLCVPAFVGCMCCGRGAAGSAASVSGASVSGASAPFSGSDTLACSECPNGIPQCWEIAVAGITNGTCPACSTTLNGTFILEYISGCDFQSPPLTGCDGGCFGGGHPSNGSWWMTVTPTGATIGSGSTVGSTFDSRFWTTTDNPCDGESIVLTNSTGSSSCCNNWPTTITATPVNCP